MTLASACLSNAGRMAAAVVLGAGWLLAGAQSMPPSGSMSHGGSMSYDTSKPPAPTATGPAVKHEGDIAYVTGGVGSEARARTNALGKDMNLKLVFAQANGDFLADVDVSIARRGGSEVLHVGAADPLLYAKLQPGTYDITASVGGRSIERHVRVPARGTHMELFSWPASATAQG